MEVEHKVEMNLVLVGDKGGSLRKLLHPPFPAGRSGVGLLLLRATVGVTLIVQGILTLADWQSIGLGAWIVGVASTVSGGLILIGLLTQLVALLVGLGCVGVAFSLIPVTQRGLLNSSLTAGYVAIIAIAICLAGPGAFSIDSRLFGRREIIIPPASYSSKP